MADELTPRLGLPIYTSGASQHPTREDFNARMELLEEAVAIARHGDSSERGLPETRGTLFMETDTGLLWFDTGTEWIRVVRIGNDGPGRALNIGGAGAEGSSQWAARADHVHPLPLATASQDGALSADDKALLNTASANATSNALARRNGSGQMSTAAPSAASHATNRGYVDGQVNSLTSRVDDMPQVRERIRSGDMDNLTTAGTYTIFGADLSNFDNLPSPLQNSIIVDVETAPSGFIIQRVYEAWTTRSHYRTRLSSDWQPWAQVLDTYQHGNYLDMLDNASQYPRDGALVRRSPTTGRADIADPSGASNIANKRYVDGLDSSNVKSYGTIGDCDDATETGFYIASNSENSPPGVSQYGSLQVFHHGSFSTYQTYQDRNNNDTFYRTRRGTSTWNDWVKSAQHSYVQDAVEAVADATWSGGPGTLVRRSSPNERIRIGDPSAADDATTKRYVDNATQDIRDAAVDDTPGTLVRRGSVNGTFWVSDPRSTSSGARDAANRRYVDNATQDIRDATYEATPSTLVRRASSSNTFYIDEGFANGHAAQRGWVQDQIDSAVDSIGAQNRGQITSGDLDDVTINGIYGIVYSNLSNISNTPPNAGNSLLLEVVGGWGWFIRQDAVNISTGNRWWRARSNTVWSDWRQVTSTVRE